MKALVFAGIETVEHTAVPDPAIREPTDAIVRVETAGICGSDLHPYHGREKGLDPGTVMGHELVGTVEETGGDVRSLSVGDRVACPFTTSCGTCAPCLEGLTSRCVKGQLLGWVSGGEGLQGAQAECVRIPLADSTLVPLPREIDPETGLLLGDVLSTGFYCAEMAGARDGGTFVVVGCGPVGLSAVASAAQRGTSLFAVDSVPERLAIAKRLGARVLDHRRDDVAAIVREATGGRGADGVMELVGASEAMKLALDIVRPGGVISSVGVHTASVFPFSPSQAYDKNLTYRTGRCPARSIMKRLLSEIVSGRFQTPPVITHSGGLADGPRLFRLFDRKEDGCVKAVLKPSSSATSS